MNSTSESEHLASLLRQRPKQDENGFIPYGRHYVSDADVAAVVQTLLSSHLNQGPAVERFEKGLAEFVSVPHVAVVASGTAGVHLAYLAARIGPGDGVIVPALTFAATANAAIYCGATPIFADIDPKTLCLDVKSVERAANIAKAAGLKVKAVAPVHYAGLPTPMRALRDLADKYRWFIIEDSCHAIGAEYRLSVDNSWEKVGGCNFADMSVLSFHPVKHLTTGEGGAVCARDPEFAERLKMLRTHGITKNPDLFFRKDRAIDPKTGVVNPWYMEMQELGYHYRLCDIQAALGASQLTGIMENIRRRRSIAQRYRDQLKNLAHVVLPPDDSEVSRHAYHLFPLRVNFAAAGLSRAEFIHGMREQKIETQVHYLPVCWHPFYEKNPQLWLADDITQCVKAYEEIISIPMYPSMTDPMVERVIAATRSLLGK